MTNLKNFVKLVAIACCLLIPPFSSFQIVNGQKEQLPDRRKGAAVDYVIIEGDIQVSPSFYQELLATARSPQAAPIKHPTKLWPNGIIPFQFETTCAATSTCNGAPLSGCVSDGSVNSMDNKQAVMFAAMNELKRWANVQFQQCANNTCSGNFVHIRDTTNDTTVGENNMCVSTPANNSAVGVKGGKQTINIASWSRQFVIVHELMHCLGILHEQSRPDRDNYVRPICENVEGGCNGDTYKVNFTIQSDAKPYGYYDFDSVMHYGQCFFSANPTCHSISPQFPDGGITLLVREPYNIEWQNKIGQRNHLSDLDRATVSFLYPFPNWRFLDTSYNGGNGPSNGSFYRPYTSFDEAVAKTPAGGTIWLLQTQTIPAFGDYAKQITVRAAPGVVGTLGG